MIFSFKNERFVLRTVLIIITNLKSLHFTDSSLNLNDVCKLSKESYPYKYNNVSNILHTYEVCLQQIDHYSGPTRKRLLDQLIYRIECFKEDLKHAYYAGNVKYNDLELVQNVEANIQNKGLKLTFGSSETINIQPKCRLERLTRSTVKHIIPLVLTGTLTEKQKACDAIFKKDKSGNLTETDIPTPKLDNIKEPKELTVPLAQPATYKVDSEEAENALTHYYKVVMKCLTLTTEHKIQVFRFNKRFYDWLTQEVLPHLKEDKCYPAFGGVLRIVETMKQNDFVPRNETANFIFYRQRNMEKNEEELRKKEDYVGRIVTTPFFPLILGPWILFVLVIIIFLAWRLGSCTCWCCEKDCDTDSSTTEVFYYPIEETPSVSLDLDDVSSEPPYSHRTSIDTKGSHRQRGGDDSHFYKLTYEQENTLMSLPLKRQWSSKHSSLSRNELPSPGKRQKKLWSNHY